MNLFGTKKQTTETNTSSSTTPTFGKFESGLTGLYDTINGWAGGNVTPYTGNITTGWTTNQNMGLESAKGLMNNDYLNRVLAGGNLDYSKDPTYLAARSRVNESLGDAIDSTKTNYAKSGLLSSSGYNRSQDRNIDNYGKAISELEGQFSAAAKQEIMNAMNVKNSLTKSFGNFANSQQQNMNDAETAKYKEFLRQQGVTEQAIPMMLQFFNLIRGFDSTQTQDSETTAHRSFLGL